MPTLSELMSENSRLHGLLADACDECEKLRHRLAEFQGTEFHPDWSMLQAAQGCIKERDEIIQRLYAIPRLIVLAADADARRDSPWVTPNTNISIDGENLVEYSRRVLSETPEISFAERGIVV